MSFIDCIKGNESLSETKKKELIKEFEELAADNVKRFGPIDGPQKAAQRYIELKAEALIQKKNNIARDAIISQQRAKDIDVRAAAYGDRKKAAGPVGEKLFFKSNVAGAIIDDLSRLAHRVGAEYEMAMRAIGDIVDKYRSKTAGFTQDVQGFKNIVSEVLGKGTGDGDAARAGKEIRKLFDSLHTEYRHVGGVIGKLQNYFPQRDIPDVVRKTPFEEYLKDKRATVDRRKMINQKTGFALNDEEFEAAVKAAYDDIINHGLDDVELATERATSLAKGTLSTRRSSRRFFHYKDADAFFANNQKYGGGDAALFDNMVDYINSITRDTAVMRELGPNSDLQIAREVSLAKTGGASPQVQRTIQGMYDTVSGRNAYGGAIGFWTKATQNTQGFLRAVLLGGAPLSAIGDSFYGVMAAKMNGLDGAKVTKRYFSFLNPLDANDRKIAARHIFVSTSANANSLAQARFADAAGTGKMRFAANAVNRASGLGIMTEGARSAIVGEAMGFMAHAKDISAKFDDLPVEMREALGRWKMDKADYENIIKAEAYLADPNGADFIRPEDVNLVNQDTARKYAAWLYEMSQQASNEPALLTRAISSGAVLGEAKQGTALRNIATSAMMFKSFGVTVLLNHTIPALQRGAAEGKWGRLAAIMTVTPLIAAGTIQAKNVLYGKTPQDMDDAKFWQAALLQSGSLGIFGDIGFADATRYDYNIGRNLAGPVPQLATDVSKLMLGNFEKAIYEGEESKFMANLAKTTQTYSPKLWYTRLLQERLIYDQMNRMADPTYDSKLRRTENKLRKDKGQEFWWGGND